MMVHNVQGIIHNDLIFRRLHVDNWIDIMKR